MMFKHRKIFKLNCFKKFTRAHLVNIKIVMEPLRNSQETQDLTILRNIQ